METWEWAARESIRDLVARYNANGDSGRSAEVVALFAADGLLAIEGLPDLVGPEAIRGFLEDAAATEQGSDPSASVRHLRHFTSTHQIDFDSREAARGRSYYQVLTERGLDHWGRYLDDYVARDGRWSFAVRRVHIDGRVPGSWAEANLARLAAGYGD